jgi:uncharacterized pyridoxamine 5'-phosphate oxidase family protein
MRFPSTFTTTQKITFFTQRNKEMKKQLKKFSKLNKIEHCLKLEKEIAICEAELLNLNK